MVVTFTVGMLWFDGNAKHRIEETIQQAVQYYFQKYGLVAKYCYVPLGVNVPSIPGLEIISNQYILSKHILVCENELFIIRSL